MSKTIFVCKPSTLTEVEAGIAEHKRFFDSKGGGGVFPAEHHAAERGLFQREEGRNDAGREEAGSVYCRRTACGL